ncbi:MAG: hypothetical protein ACLT3Y_03540 [Ruminococcus callidus]
MPPGGHHRCPQGDGHGAAAYDSETGKFYESYRKHTPERMHGTAIFSQAFCPVR